MTHQVLQGRRVAILTTDGFEQSELFEPKKALEDAGAKVDIVSPHGGSVKAWHHTDWGKSIKVDLTVAEADPDVYQALMIPGGVMNPDQLRMDTESVKFVQAFVDSGRPIAAICHAPQVLIETGMVKGRKLTSWPSLRTDLINAGADWVDQQVVSDQGLVTSRKPDDIPAFSRKMIEEFAEGTHVPSKPSHTHSSPHSEGMRMAGLTT